VSILKKFFSLAPSAHANFGLAS